MAFTFEQEFTARLQLYIVQVSSLKCYARLQVDRHKFLFSLYQ